MKKHLLIAGLSFLFFNLYSQFPNGGFEAWENIEGYENPDVSPAQFSSINDQVYWQSGMIPAFEVPGVSGSALRLETVEVDGEISPAFAILGGTPEGDEEPLVFPGGFPFTDMAVTGLQVDLRYDIDVTSPGYIVVQFKLDGMPVTGGPDDGGTFFFPISGDVSTFTTSTFDFTPAITQMPDSCVIGFISNDLLSEPATGFVGNFLEIDNLMFTGTAQEIPGGDMDTWVPSINIQVPEEWEAFIYGPIESILQSDDSYEGNYSCQLNTVDGNGESLAGVLFRGALGEEGIIATEELPDDVFGLDFAYKYTAVENDTAIVVMVLSEDLENSPEGLAFIGLPLSASTDWQTQQLNWEWVLDWLNPQYYALVIASSNFDNLGFVGAGSQLWVDGFEWYLDPEACSFEPEIMETPPILCPDETFTLTATECDSYTWYRKLIGLPGDPEMVGDGSQTLDVDVAEFGGYFVWVECTVDGCTEASDPVTVDGWVFAPPAIASDGTTDLCEGETTVLENAFGSYATYQWVNNGVDIGGAESSSYEVTESGQYTLTVTPQECPDFEMTSGVPVTITVHELPTPVIEIGAEVTTTETYTTYTWYSPDVATGSVVSETGSLTLDNPDIVGNSAQVVVTDEWGCEGVSDVATWLGLDEMSFSESFQISPNPAQDVVYLNFSGSQPERITLFDLTGEEVSSWTSHQSALPYDISALPAGVYLISFTAGQKVVTKRLVKM